MRTIQQNQFQVGRVDIYCVDSLHNLLKEKLSFNDLVLHIEGNFGEEESLMW